MPARGTSYPARYFYDQHEVVYPIGQIYVLRAQQKSLSRYLVWYLNRQGCQQLLRSSISGTTVMSLKKSALLDIKIELPDIETQNRIAHLQELSDYRSLLQAELAVLQASELEAACEIVFEEKK
jgi:restriction endonuclease S subunit